MNATESPVIKITFPNSKIEGLFAPEPNGKGRWTLHIWLMLIALIFVAHITVLFIFGEHTFPAPRPVINVPQLQLANSSSELLALDDPTLFVLPRAGDLASVGLQTPIISPPSFRWSEAPHLLPLPAETLGATFAQFMQTNVFAGFQLNFKPQPKLTAPVLAFQPAFAENSTLQIEGDLAKRKLLNEIVLTNWPCPDVIASSRVQVLVDADGNVVSAVLLPSNNSLKNETHYDVADQRALELSRAAQFTRASHLTIGRMIFNWRAVPPAAAVPPVIAP
jgi:hypothetical protein